MTPLLLIPGMMRDARMFTTAIAGRWAAVQQTKAESVKSY